MERVTLWQHGNDTLQVAVALLDLDTWDVVVECVEQVGPFETVAEALERARDAGICLRDRQLAGQTFLRI